MFDFDADDRGIFDSDSKKRQFITPWTVNYVKHFVSKTIKFDICILCIHQTMTLVVHIIL